MNGMVGSHPTSVQAVPLSRSDQGSVVPETITTSHSPSWFGS